MRKSAICLNCGEPREIAAHGLCFACYRREVRADDRKFAVVDRHSPAVRREHKKLFRGFTSVMVGLADLGVQESDVLAIRRMLEPYMTPIARFLSSPAEPNESQHQVNSEQNPEPLFTVHTSRVPQVFIDQLMGHAGGLAQTYAKANDEYRRTAIDKLEELIVAGATKRSNLAWQNRSVTDQITSTGPAKKSGLPSSQIQDSGQKSTSVLLQFPQNVVRGK